MDYSSEITFRNLPSRSDEMANDKSGKTEGHNGLSIKDFTQDTSMHGLKYVTAEGYIIRRLFWAVAVVGMGATLIYMLCAQMVLFWAHPSLTKYSIGEATILDFPAVTICNTNGINTKYFSPDEKLRNYLYDTGHLGIISQPINWSDPFYSTWKMDEEFMRKVANRLENLIFLAYWRGETINVTEYFTERITPNGLCYTFNDMTQGGGREVLQSQITGSLAGLVVALNVEQESYYYGKFNMAAGVKVVLHDPHEEPDVMSLGFTIPPGYTSYISMRHQTNTYLPKPYKAFTDGYCVESHLEEFENPLKYYPTYSQFACLVECKAEVMVQQCGCRTFDLPGNASVCSLKQAKECAIPANEAFFLDPKYKQGCDCPKPCIVKSYKTQLSMAYFPADGVQNYWKFFKDIRKNFLELRLFYQEMEFDQTEQVPEYTLEGILANLGGQMGLFLGASVLTATELVEFLLLHMVIIVQKLKSPFTGTRVETFRPEK